MASSLSQFVCYTLLLWLGIFIDPTSGLSQSVSWQYQDLLTDSLASGANPDFLIDRAGNFHLSFWDRNRDQLVYGFKSNESAVWHYEVVDPGCICGYKSAITVDSLLQPHIVYAYNALDSIFLRYTYKQAGEWIVDDIPLNSNLGPYGFDEFFPVYSQASLDIQLTHSGDPLITFFDGSANVESELLCGNVLSVYEDYDLHMGFAHKGDGVWNITDTLRVPHNGIGECLVTGDRFGEFCQLVPVDDQEYYAITNSLHNNELLLFSHNPSDLNNWSYQVIDSVNRFAANGANDRQKFREGFDFIDVVKVSDTIVHLVYGVSDLYGYGMRTTYIHAAPPQRRSYFYARFHIDSIGIADYSPYFYELGQRAAPNNPNTHDGHYRTYHTLAVKDDSTIYATHFNANTGHIVVNHSHDGGFTWRQDTLGQWVTNVSLQSQIWEDSLYLVFYDGLADQLIEAKAIMADSLEWNIRPIFRNTRTGNVFHSIVPDSINQDNPLLHYVFHEQISDQLFWGNTEGIIEPVSDPGLDINHAATGIFREKTSYAVYDSWRDQQLLLARQTESGWQSSLLADTVLVDEMTLTHSSDSLHLIYYDIRFPALYHLSRSLNQDGTQGDSKIILSEIDKIAHLSVHADAQDQLHLSFVERSQNRLIYGYTHPDLSGWSWDTVTTPATYQVGQHMLNTLPNGDVVIAFRDEVTNTLHFAQKQAGVWTFEDIPTATANVTGVMMRMQVDNDGGTWLLFNQVRVNDELIFMKRDISGYWARISQAGNPDQINQLFDLHLIHQQLYVIGKKERPTQRGIGLLSASTPIVTATTSVIPSKDNIKLYPNPVQDLLHIDIPQGQLQSITLYDSQGRLIRSISYETALQAPPYQYSIPLTDLAQGLYFCKIAISGIHYHHKILKSN